MQSKQDNSKMEITKDYLKKEYSHLGEEEIEKILSSKNPQKELELRIGIDNAAKEEDVMGLRSKLEETYETHKNANKNN